MKGHAHTAATKRKMSKARKGFRWSKEMREHFSAIRKGKPAPWVRERLLGKPAILTRKGRAAHIRRNKKRALPEDERRRRRAESARRCQLIARYGISAADYDALLIRQKGVCRICRKPCSTQKRLAVDHDHKTKRIRGLLCRRCNRGLGHFSLVTLRRAVLYLESFDAH
jgi:hypothetical protein